MNKLANLKDFKSTLDPVAQVEQIVMFPYMECKKNKDMIFHVAHKLNAVIGLNNQELDWLESLGAKVEREATWRRDDYRDDCN